MTFWPPFGRRLHNTPARSRHRTVERAEFSGYYSGRGEARGQDADQAMCGPPLLDARRLHAEREVVRVPIVVAAECLSFPGAASAQQILAGVEEAFQ
jgi:hypothetical protein